MAVNFSRRISRGNDNETIVGPQCTRAWWCCFGSRCSYVARRRLGWVESNHLPGLYKSPALTVELRPQVGRQGGLEPPTSPLAVDNVPAFGPSCEDGHVSEIRVLALYQLSYCLPCVAVSEPTATSCSGRFLARFLPLTCVHGPPVR